MGFPYFFPVIIKKLDQYRPSHFTKDGPSNIFPSQNPANNYMISLQTIYATAWKTTKGITREIVIRRNAHAAVHLRMINQFQECVYLRK